MNKLRNAKLSDPFLIDGYRRKYVGSCGKLSIFKPMFRIAAIFVLVLLSGSAFASDANTIVLTNSNTTAFKSFSRQVLFYEDKAHAYELEDIIHKPDSEFEHVTRDNPIARFTTSRFWMKFSVKNESDFTDFIFETGRPITDTVVLYEMNGNELVNKYENGDHYGYYSKEILHRKNLFPITLEQGETKSFYVQFGSEGEGILFPLMIHEKMAFFGQDFRDQFKNGFYYGMIALVIVIYFFFFLLLKDITFLYYILYVFFQGLLQFTLDGYSYHHFFSNGGYMVNRFPLITGAFAIIFMLIYVNKFLSMKRQLPRFRKVFYAAGILMGVGLIFTFLPGGAHHIAYPMVNGISLFSIVLSVSAILYLHAIRKPVDIYFTVAFLALITGAVIFILGNFNVIENSLLFLNALKVSSVVEFVILSISMSFKYRELQQDKEEAQARALKNLQEKNALMDQSNIMLEKQVKERTQEIERQKEELARSNEEIVSSIKYAKRIQTAILPGDDHVKNLLPESFIFYCPKDVVSGDFYFVEPLQLSEKEEDRLTLFAAVDCTGHGVPGAFMSIVGNNFLSQSITEPEVTSPGKVLDFLNDGVSRTLRQNIEGSAVRDGMDIAMCTLNHDRTKLMFSGAKNPLYLIRRRDEVYPDKYKGFLRLKAELDDAVLYEISGDKQAIGNTYDGSCDPFRDYEIDLMPGDQIYVFTDGFADQFGGPRGKKYNYRRFRELLINMFDKPMAEQEKLLKSAFEDWIGDKEQIDDVLVISVKI